MSSATTAYRKDLCANGHPFGANDDAWIAVASMVEQAAAVDDPEASAALVDAAAADVVRSVGESELRRRSSQQWAGAETSGLDALVLVAEIMREAGARNLAASLLDGAARLVPTDGPLHGRMLAQRARIALVAGETEVAADLYDQVDHIGRMLNLADLRAWSAIGAASIAQMRGNFPRVVECGTQALRLAERAGVRGLIWHARYALTLGNAITGAVDDALRHGWEVFRLSSTEVEEATALQAVGQLLLQAGDLRSARSAFASVATRKLPPILLLPALGGLALTAISPADRALLDWAAAEVLMFRDSSAVPYAFASALLDCATALWHAGRREDAARYRDESLELSTKLGFHELAYKAEDLSREEVGTTTHAFTSERSTEILRSVRELEPERLPEHVSLAAAPGVG